MLYLSHQERLQAMSKIKRLPKPDGTYKGTHPHDYSLNLASGWMMELSKVDIQDLHNKTHSKLTPATRKSLAKEMMKHLYTLSDHLDAASYAAIYYHLNQVINE